MSGNPDVLEYYRNKTSKKPIRTIDLRECEVQMQTEQRLVKREFQNQHLFVVKTSSRMFYLVAKTEEEMNSWVSQIREICHFGPLRMDDGTGKELARRHSSLQLQFKRLGCEKCALQIKLIISISYKITFMCSISTKNIEKHSLVFNYCWRLSSYDRVVM